MTLINENLILENLYLVKKVALKFQNEFLGYSDSDNLYFNLDDLIGWGTFGLIDAAKTYNSNLNVPFNFWAKQKIFWGTIDGLRENGLKYRNYKKKNERNIENNYESIFPIYFCDLNLYSNDSEEIINPEEYLSDPNWESDFIDEQKKEKIEKLYEIINKLSEKDQIIIKLYYWEDKTLKEIGKIMNFNESRASQKINSIEKKIREIYFETKKSRKTPKNNKTGCTGVKQDKNKYISEINKDKKHYFLGKFNNIEDAIIARLKAEKKLFGKEFAPQKHLFKEYGIEEIESN